MFTILQVEMIVSLCSNDCFLTASSVTLNNLIQRNFPEEFEERKAEMNAVTQAGGETLPLFVMDVVLPMQHTILNVFEPRYRLMVLVSFNLHYLKWPILFGVFGVSQSFT